MPEPVQTTIYGSSEPLRAPERTEEQAAPARLFTAPQTMRGQLAISTDERSEDLTARIAHRVAAAEARGAHVVGWIPSAANPRDVILSDDPPGSQYGTCP